MDAGRELDALVAEKVMGLPVRWREDPYREIGMPVKGREPWLKGRANGVEYDWAPVPRYSADMSAAWKIVDAMNARGHALNRLAQIPYWACWFGGPYKDSDTDPPIVFGSGSTAPVAICAAALAAVGEGA